jgi:hypothetical protein
MKPWRVSPVEIEPMETRAARPMFEFGINRVVGPVFVIRPAGRPILTWKVLYKDGAQQVVSAPMDVLWQGVDGQAWSYQRGALKSLGTMNKNGVIEL